MVCRRQSFVKLLENFQHPWIQIHNVITHELQVSSKLSMYLMDIFLSCELLLKTCTHTLYGCNERTHCTVVRELA
jgi:hypothetical protein